MNRFKRARRVKIPKYMTQVLRLAQHQARGTIQHVTVAHDDCCAHWRGRACNCKPIVKLRAVRKLDDMDAP